MCVFTEGFRHFTFGTVMLQISLSLSGVLIGGGCDLPSNLLLCPSLQRESAAFSVTVPVVVAEGSGIRRL